MPYRAPLKDIRFCLEHVVGAGALADTERYAEATPETLEAILTEMGKLADETLAPLQRPGDEGARLEGGKVDTARRVCRGSQGDCRGRLDWVLPPSR